MALVQITTLLLLAALQIDFSDAFRPDYVYLTATRAWYKLHEEYKKWSDARDTCRLEGALLFHPDSEEEFRLVRDGLAVPTDVVMYGGISDLKKRNEYETVDGRPLSQVFNKWEPGYNNSGWHCGALNFASLEIRLHVCDWQRSFICKAADPVEEAKAIANLTAKIADLERKLAHQIAVFETVERDAQDMKIQAENQTATLKAQLKDLEREVNQLKQPKQPTCCNGLDRIAEAVANHDAALERISKAVGENQAAAMERISKAIEKQATAIETSSKADDNHAVALERISKSIEKQATAMETSSKADENHAVALEKISKAIEKQATAMETSSKGDENQTAALQRLVETMQRQALNQTVAFERQALALEAMASNEQQ